MNPDNNALKRTYFIGGPPRVGKTILALSLAKNINGHVVSTDSIRNAAKKACADNDSDLFIINRTENVSDEEWLKNHLDHPEITVDHQNRESKALWPSLVSFCNSFCEDDAVHIVEGVALLPSLIAHMEHKPEHVVFVGNTSPHHLQAMLDHAKQFPDKDWMSALSYTPEKFQGMANFIKEMSLYFKEESGKYGFQYFEIDDKNFEGSLNDIKETILKQ